MKRYDVNNLTTGVGVMGLTDTKPYTRFVLQSLNKLMAGLPNWIYVQTDLEKIVDEALETMHQLILEIIGQDLKKAENELKKKARLERSKQKDDVIVVDDDRCEAAESPARDLQADEKKGDDSD